MEKGGRPIFVSTGLLTKEHYRKIGNALWEFIWLLWRVTRKETDDLGIVLGGKPIKKKDISKELGKSERRIGEALKKLEKEKYIFTKRTPYGQIIWVCKAKKRWDDFVLSRQDDNGKSRQDTSSFLYTENVLSNKEVVVEEVVRGLPPLAEKTMYKLQPDDPDKTIDYDTLEEVDTETKEVIKQKGYNPKDTNILLAWGVEKLGRKFNKPLKQKKHIADMLSAGNTPEAIKSKWEELEGDEFWSDRGIDFSIVASQIDKVKRLAGYTKIS